MHLLTRSPVSALLATVALLVAAAGLAAAPGPRFTRTEVDVSLPDVTLINQDGRAYKLLDLEASDKPVFVEFIFATCTTICPILSAGYNSMQRRLGDSRDQVHLVSITIDPEHDGPGEMKSYLDRYDAKPGWDFFTGTRTDIDRVMRGFDAFVADKMSHRPLVFIWSPRRGRWIQLKGFAGSKDLMEELRIAAAGSGSHEE